MVVSISLIDNLFRRIQKYNQNNEKHIIRAIGLLADIKNMTYAWEVILKKKINNVYYKHLSYENILNCYNIIKKTCKNKRAINKFELNLNTNIYNIYNALKTKTYKPYKSLYL